MHDSVPPRGRRMSFAVFVCCEPCGVPFSAAVCNGVTESSTPSGPDLREGECCATLRDGSASVIQNIQKVNFCAIETFS